METLRTLTEAVELLIDNPDVEIAEIHAMLNRGVSFIAGGATRSYNVPTIPPLPGLSEDFDVDTVAGINQVAMPATFQRWAFQVYGENGDLLTRYDSLNNFKRMTKKDAGKAGNVRCWCLWGNILHYSESPVTPETLVVCGHRYPVDMVLDTDIPDGIPGHLAYDLLTSYCAMKFNGEIEQDMNGPGYSTMKYTNLFNSALTDLHSVIPKDEPGVYTPIDAGIFIGATIEV